MTHRCSLSCSRVPGALLRVACGSRQVRTTPGGGRGFPRAPAAKDRASLCSHKWTAQQTALGGGGSESGRGRPSVLAFPLCSPDGCHSPRHCTCRVISRREQRGEDGASHIVGFFGFFFFNQGKNSQQTLFTHWPELSRDICYLNWSSHSREDSTRQYTKYI